MSIEFFFRKMIAAPCTALTTGFCFPATRSREKQTSTNGHET